MNVCNSSLCFCYNFLSSLNLSLSSFYKLLSSLNLLNNSIGCSLNSSLCSFNCFISSLGFCLQFSKFVCFCFLSFSGSVKLVLCVSNLVFSFINFRSLSLNLCCKLANLISQISYLIFSCLKLGISLIFGCLDFFNNFSFIINLGLSIANSSSKFANFCLLLLCSSASCFSISLCLCSFFAQLCCGILQFLKFVLKLLNLLVACLFS